MSSFAPAHHAPFLSRLGGRLQLGRPEALIVAGLLLVGIGPPAYLLQTGNALSTGYTIQRLRAERNAWRVRNQQLELELAKARSLAWIETEAITRLRMQPPIDRTIVRVDMPPPSPVAPPAPAVSNPTARFTSRTAP